MPDLLSNNDSFDDVYAPNGTDPRNAASVRGPIQSLTNRTYHTNQAIVNGVPRVRTFVDAPTLRAYGTPVDGQHAVVGTVGLFQYSATSTASDDGLFSIRPTAVRFTDPGRWINTSAAVAGAPGGVARLDTAGNVPASELGNTATNDAGGRLPAASLRGALQAIASSSNASGSLSAGSNAAISGMTVTLPNCKSGDLLRIHFATNLFVSGASAGGIFRAYVTSSGGTKTAAFGSAPNPQAAGASLVVIEALGTCTSDGTVYVEIDAQIIAGSFAFSDATLFVERYSAPS